MKERINLFVPKRELLGCNVLPHLLILLQEHLFSLRRLTFEERVQAAQLEGSTEFQKSV
jgi:hypothetical protein